MKPKPVRTMKEFIFKLKAFPTRDKALAEARATLNSYHHDNPGQPPVFVALLSDGEGFRGVLNPGDVRSRLQIDAIASRYGWRVEYVAEADVPGGNLRAVCSQGNEGAGDWHPECESVSRPAEQARASLDLTAHNIEFASRAPEDHNADGGDYDTSYAPAPGGSDMDDIPF